MGRAFHKFRAGIVFVIAAVLVLGTTPAAWAYSGTGDGTPSNPFKISTCEQLQEMQDNLSASYVLTGDIDCSASSGWNSGAGFIPIGTFTGTLDGQNYKIKNITINVSDTTTYTGLFGFTNGATITKVHLEGGTVTQDPSNSNYMASLIGFSLNTTLSYVSSSATVNGQYGGGLVGYLTGGSLSKSWFSGTTALTGYRYTGGITGLTVNTTLSDVYTSGTIGARGGIAGVLGTGTTLSNVYSTANVTYGDTDAAGGLFGSVDGFIDLTTASNIFFDGTITATLASDVGGVIGSFEANATISGAYYNAFGCNCSTGIGTTSGGSGTATAVNAANATPNYFKSNSTNAPMSAWNFSTVWQTNTGNYPTIRSTSAPSDGDTDGSLDGIEAAGPHDGDSNDDGIPDAAQTNVTTLINPITGKYASLASTCDSNSGVSIAAESANSAQDAMFSYPFGLMSFTLHCTVGQTATVTQYFYYATDPGTVVARKYNAVTNTYQAITGATIAKTTIGGQAVVSVSYQITDGGALDQDGVANGTIVDPAGLAVSPVAAPNTGLGGTSL